MEIHREVIRRRREVIHHRREAFRHRKAVNPGEDIHHQEGMVMEVEAVSRRRKTIKQRLAD